MKSIFYLNLKSKCCPFKGDLAILIKKTNDVAFLGLVT